MKTKLTRSFALVMLLTLSLSGCGRSSSSESPKYSQSWDFLQKTDSGAAAVGRKPSVLRV